MIHVGCVFSFLVAVWFAHFRSLVREGDGEGGGGQDRFACRWLARSLPSFSAPSPSASSSGVPCAASLSLLPPPTSHLPPPSSLLPPPSAAPRTRTVMATPLLPPSASASRCLNVAWFGVVVLLAQAPGRPTSCRAVRIWCGRVGGRQHTGALCGGPLGATGRTAYIAALPLVSPQVLACPQLHFASQHHQPPRRPHPPPHPRLHRRHPPPPNVCAAHLPSSATPAFMRGERKVPG